MKMPALRFLIIFSLLFIGAFPASANMTDPKDGMADQGCKMDSGDKAGASMGCKMDESGQCACENCGDEKGCDCGNCGEEGCDCDNCDKDECEMPMKKMGGHMMGMGHMGRMDRMGGMGMMGKPARTPDYYLSIGDIINLTDDQAEKLMKLESGLKKEMLTKGARVKVLELELSDIVTSPDFKVADAETKLKEIEAARTELRLSVIKTAAAARDILTPDQLKKAREHANSREMGFDRSHEMMKKDMMERMMRNKMDMMR